MASVDVSAGAGGGALRITSHTSSTAIKVSAKDVLDRDVNPRRYRGKSAKAQASQQEDEMINEWADVCPSPFPQILRTTLWPPAWHEYEQRHPDASKKKAAPKASMGSFKSFTSGVSGSARTLLRSNTVRSPGLAPASSPAAQGDGTGSFNSESQPQLTPPPDVAAAATPTIAAAATGDFEPNVGVVRIHSFAAVDLIAADVGGTSDAYCKLRLSGRYSHGGPWSKNLMSHEYRTKTQSTTRRVIEDRAGKPLTFKVPRAGGQIEFRWYDEDQGVLNADDWLGTAIIDVAQLKNNTTAFYWVRIASPEDFEQNDVQTEDRRYAGVMMAEIQFESNPWSEALSSIWREPPCTKDYDRLSLNSVYNMANILEKKTKPFIKFAEFAASVAFWQLPLMTVTLLIVCLAVVRKGEYVMVSVHGCVIGFVFWKRFKRLLIDRGVDMDVRWEEAEREAKKEESHEAAMNKKNFWLLENFVAPFNTRSNRQLQQSLKDAVALLIMVEGIVCWKDKTLTWAFIGANACGMLVHLYLPLKVWISLCVVGVFLGTSPLGDFCKRAAFGAHLLLTRFKQVAPDVELADKLRTGFLQLASNSSDKTDGYKFRRDHRLIAAAFSSVDEDESGGVGVEELARALSDLDKGEEQHDRPSSQSAEQLMSVFDTGVDRQLDLLEFEMLVHIADTTKGFALCQIRFALRSEEGVECVKHKSAHANERSFSPTALMVSHASRLRWVEDRLSFEYMPGVDQHTARAKTAPSLARAQSLRDIDQGAAERPEVDTGAAERATDKRERLSVFKRTGQKVAKHRSAGHTVKVANFVHLICIDEIERVCMTSTGGSKKIFIIPNDTSKRKPLVFGMSTSMQTQMFAEGVMEIVRGWQARNKANIADSAR